ncbi:bestrophin family protein [Apibacter sp. HY039]|uniref:bestrophin family protein n=1 Tax=Apibacter sp. HY039 TaxID=2501476 RepID=UPI000FEB6F8A|nr:bestrophin family protein [Apibacter sp. HY039]
MIIYNPKGWFSFVFKIYKADTITKLWPMLVVTGIFAFIIAYVEINYIEIDKMKASSYVTVGQSLVGFVLSLVLVFRTNTAYDRWWEGRKLWGQLTNISRNLSIKLHALLPSHDKENREFFIKYIPLFAQILHRHLTNDTTRYTLDEHENSDDTTEFRYSPSQVAVKLTHKIVQLNKENILTGEQLLFINQELKGFMDVCGGCERIKNTPIPFSYVLFIKKFIALYVFSMPIGYVINLGYWVVPLVMFVFYVLISLELVAEDIEDPFNNGDNDIPTKKIAENIKKSCLDILAKNK